MPNSPPSFSSDPCNSVTQLKRRSNAEEIPAKRPRRHTGRLRYVKSLQRRHPTSIPEESLNSTGLEGDSRDAVGCNLRLSDSSPSRRPLMPRGIFLDKAEDSATHHKPSSKLRSTHRGALVTILHRALYDREYERASRAWGMLLRAERGGISFDLRSCQRWGIGAELKIKGSPNAPISCLQRLESIKQYFSRLNLQFPYRRSSPEVVSALHIYPIYFSSCIYILNESMRFLEQDIPKLDQPKDPAQPRISRSAYRTPENSFIPESSDIYRSALRQATALFNELQTLVSSPPFSDSTSLDLLKRMLALWLANLSKSLD